MLGSPRRPLWAGLAAPGGGASDREVSSLAWGRPLPALPDLHGLMPRWPEDSGAAAGGLQVGGWFVPAARSLHPPWAGSERQGGRCDSALRGPGSQQEAPAPPAGWLSFEDRCFQLQYQSKLWGQLFPVVIPAEGGTAREVRGTAELQPLFRSPSLCDPHLYRLSGPRVTEGNVRSAPQPWGAQGDRCAVLVNLQPTPVVPGHLQGVCMQS